MTANAGCSSEEPGFDGTGLEIDRKGREAQRKLI